MKQFGNGILLLIVSLVLIFLFVFMCLPPGHQTVTARLGKLDLRAEDLGAAVYNLDGEWGFYPDQLVIPDAHSNPPAVITVPGCWTGEGYPLEGFATFHLTVLLPGDTPLMLYLPEIYTAYVLSVGGSRVHSAGVLSRVPELGRGLFENALLTVVPEDGVLDLVLQVSNYNYAYGGLPCSLLLAESRPLMAYFLRTRTLYCMAVGGVLMAAFYHLALYLFRRREPEYLLFSILCILCFGKFLTEKNGLAELLHLIPFDMFGSRVYVVLFLLHSASVMLLGLYVFNRKFLFRARFALSGYLIGMTVLFLIMPMNKLYNPLALAALTPAIGVTAVITLRSELLRKNPQTRLYCAALILYLLIAGAAKLFLEDFLFMTGLLPDLFIILIQSLILSRNYAHAFDLLEEWGGNLERMVDIRTGELQSANLAMKELVSNMSHDLKTPLTVLSVNLEQLADSESKQKPETRRRQIAVAYKQSLDLQRITQNLFEVCRLETWDRSIVPAAVSLPELLAQVQEKYEDFLEGEGLYFDVTCDCNCEILLVRQRIWSVFDNLIYNAVRYTEQGGISISATAGEDTVAVTVTDTGRGIPPEYLPRIFDRFYKVSQDRGARSGDSGLGLYIVRRTMESIGGTVSAKSVPGEGTSITLVFRRA